MSPGTTAASLGAKWVAGSSESMTSSEPMPAFTRKEKGKLADREHAWSLELYSQYLEGLGYMLYNDHRILLGTSRLTGRKILTPRIGPMSQSFHTTFEAAWSCTPKVDEMEFDLVISRKLKYVRLKRKGLSFRSHVDVVPWEWSKQERRLVVKLSDFDKLCKE